ncbi:hypothetical protein B0H34DRAFT_662790 [Crassisporium funariophilum]|nr:hypothetical protein B0H34DRAFT_662790 [Crassisporium funariophilum]
MYSAYMALVLAILCMNAALLVNAGLYILEPSQGSTCRSGQPCTIRWIDDGVRPVLSAVGVATVGLFTGKQQLVQTIPAVNVANSISTTFTPMSAAGPNSDA